LANVFQFFFIFENAKRCVQYGTRKLKYLLQKSMFCWWNNTYFALKTAPRQSI